MNRLWVAGFIYGLFGLHGFGQEAARPPAGDTFAGTHAGEERSGNGLGMKFCWCPPGKFMMGSPETEQDCGPNEVQVEVTLTRGYWLGKYEVTQAEYEQLMGKNPSAFSAGGGFRSKVTGQDTKRFPVETVSWTEAVEFCQKLTERERTAGRLPAEWENRLPTEAEWEYACRAGTTTATAFGDSLSSKQANFFGDRPYNGAEKGPYLQRTCSVGSYASNAWGLHDMHGNVWEWCQDSYTEKMVGVVDPQVDQAGSLRVYRGGSWNNIGQYFRSANRLRITPGYRNNHVGFRVAVGPSRNPAEVKPPETPQPPVASTPVKTGEKPGEEWLGNSLQMKFCWCPPGKFMMGSPETEQDRGPNEVQVEVTLTRGYWLGKYEVTQAEYEQLMGKNPSAFSKVAGHDTARFPVDQVSWNQAVEFCQKLTERERTAGRLPAEWEYRLPTEAEWEYACRAGTTTATAFGDSLNSKQANFNGASPYNDAEQGPNLQRPSGVGSYPANSWGLHDMHGNAYEWCRDSYGPRRLGGIDPVGETPDSDRVIRGGCWNNHGRSCRSANRFGFKPDFRFKNLDFRVAVGPSINPADVGPTEVPKPLVAINSLKAGEKPGEDWQGNGLQMKFCWCPPGKFTGGSPDAEKDRAPNESQVEVTLTQGFWLGKYEVTQAEYRQVTLKNPSAFSAGGGFRPKVTGQDTSRFPVETVSWTEAVEFCEKLTERERKAGRLPADWEYRLPTEAEWEYACRAGTTTATSFGDSLSSKQANFNGDSPYNEAENGPNLGSACRVGSYASNGWGLHDMHGNVSEWCRDLYSEKLAGGVNTPVDQAGSFRVYRGGSWGGHGRLCRSAYRSRMMPAIRINFLGFRVAIGPSLNPAEVPKPLVASTPLKAGEKPGEEWQGSCLQMKFCWCPPGKFTMGSPTTEKDRGSTEKQVEVTLTQGYWLGKYEVTQAEYEQVMGKNPSATSATGTNEEKVTGQDTTRFPVENVSWLEAAEYLKKLTDQERAAGRLPASWEYRLPTEAEWEYACRAGTTTATAYGETISSKQANFIGSSPYNGAEQGPNLRRPAPVGSYAPNAWGLYDMHGNVFEWCFDWYIDKLSGGVNPQGAQTGSSRVYRGGSWDYYGRSCRSANRFGHDPDFRYFNLGFRVALVPSGK